MANTSHITPLRAKVTQILNRLLAGEFSAEQVIAAWPAEEEYVEDAIVREAYHTLQHYVADEDIRSRDADYARYQQEELKEIVQRLSSSSARPGSSPEPLSTPSASSTSRHA